MNLCREYNCLSHSCFPLSNRTPTLLGKLLPRMKQELNKFLSQETSLLPWPQGGGRESGTQHEISQRNNEG